MLASHEFGHYLAARHHGVSVTLPYFIPFPSFPELFLSFGTLGAVIRIKSSIKSSRVLFDIGAAGPLAGFVVSMTFLVIGFVTLPPIEYLYSIHPEYAHMDEVPLGGLVFGNNLIYSLLQSQLVPAGTFVPPMNEIYHYPFLCVGWFGLFVTAMNLIPVGQLDGGHITTAMFGTHARLIGRMALGFLVILGVAGFAPFFDVNLGFGWVGWLLWAALLVTFIRAFRLQRAPVESGQPLARGRMLLGWLCITIFVGSFSMTPFTWAIP